LTSVKKQVGYRNELMPMINLPKLKVSHILRLKSIDKIDMFLKPCRIDVKDRAEGSKMTWPDFLAQKKLIQNFEKASLSLRTDTTATSSERIQQIASNTICWYYSLFLTTVGFISHSPGDTGGSNISTSNDGQHGTSNESQSRHTRNQATKKRLRDEYINEEEDDGENDDGENHFPGTQDGENPRKKTRRLFACPFFKSNPLVHVKCKDYPGFASIHRVKYV
jgi:hypothetical protein